MWPAVLRELFVIALAGAAGALCRYGVSLGCARLFGPHFPWGTLAVNILGCFLMGVVIHAGEVAKLLPPLVVMAVAIGFLGALTTFSSFGIQTLHLWENARPGLALLNVAANVLLGLFATWGGLALARAFFPNV